MSFGLETFLADGSLHSTYDTSLGRVIGSMALSTSNGSVAVPALSQGKPWYVAVPAFDETTNVYPPTVTISGTTISWTWPAIGQQYRAATVLIYGVR